MNNHMAIGPQILSVDASQPMRRFHVEAIRGSLEVRLNLPEDSPVGVTWRQNGQKIPGADGPVLRLSGLRPSDSDVYTAVTTDGEGMHESQAFLLIVVPSLSLTDQSARGCVADGSPLIAGFVVGRGAGVEASKTYLIRVVSSSLQQFGVDRPLNHPRVTLSRRNQNIDHLLVGDRSFHDKWAPRLGAFALTSDSDEFVARADLGPGNYTLMVEAEGEDTGEVLIEIYEINEAVESTP